MPPTAAPVESASPPTAITSSMARRKFPRVSQPAVQGQGDRVIGVAADAPMKPEGVCQLHGGGVAPEMAFRLAEQASEFLIGIGQ
jgi:hypothetical protein